MDPNVLLKKLLEDCKTFQRDVLEQKDPEAALSDAMFGPSDPIAQLNDIIEAVQNLDDWVRRGGFLPAAWEGRQLQERLPIPEDVDQSFTEDVIEILYPQDDPLRDWCADTLDEIHNALDNRNLVPQYYLDAQDAQFEEGGEEE